MVQVDDLFTRWRLLEHKPCKNSKGESEDGWICECICDKRTVRWVRSQSLKSGASRSCGCLGGMSRTKHGLSRTREYKAYVCMIARCYDPSHDSYKYYGGRKDHPVKVCDRWRESVEFFYEDVQKLDGYRPGIDGLSLDRIDCNGDYSPENCRWSTNLDQQNNKRKTIFVCWNNNRRISLASLARELSVDYHRLYRTYVQYKDSLTLDEIIEKAKENQTRVNLASIARAEGLPYNQLYHQHMTKHLLLDDAIRVVRQTSER